MNERPRGDVGEILVRSHGAMLGYWNQPELTRQTLVDGWVRTGDAGYMDEEGFVFLVDRVKDMIVSGGENVYSAEVENALSAHADVVECAVIGVPDERWGERVHAIVRLEAEADGLGRGDHRPLPHPDRRLQMPPLGGVPRRAAAAVRRRQDPEDRTAQGLLAGAGTADQLT